VVTAGTRKEMKKMLGEIQTGKFAKEWIKENQKGRPVFNKLSKKDDNILIERVGKNLRKMMPWI
jgi:ketol-acid reductoisomerase